GELALAPAVAVHGPLSRRRFEQVLAGGKVRSHLSHQTTAPFQARPLGGIVQLSTHPEPFLPAAPDRPCASRVRYLSGNLPTDHAPTRRPGPARTVLRHCMDARTNARCSALPA